jgi:hypothetical protein
MKIRPSLLFVALASLIFATPSHGDAPLDLLMKSVTNIVKFWNWGSGKSGQHDQTIREGDKPQGGGVPSKGKVVRDTAKSSLESVKGAFRGPEGEEVRKGLDPAAERAEAMAAARKRGEEEVFHNSLVGVKEKDGRHLPEGLGEANPRIP